MRCKSALVTSVLVLGLLVSAVVLASPVSVTYSGETTDIGANNYWDYQWVITWTNNETLSYWWVDIVDDLDGSHILGYIEPSGWSFQTTGSNYYYVGTANDPYGVPTGQHVLLWVADSPSAGPGTILPGVWTDSSAPPGQNFTWTAGGSGVSPSSGTTWSLTPEPSSMAILLLGLGAAGGLLRKRKRCLAD